MYSLLHNQGCLVAISAHPEAQSSLPEGPTLLKSERARIFGLDGGQI